MKLRLSQYGQCKENSAGSLLLINIGIYLGRLFVRMNEEEKSLKKGCSTHFLLASTITMFDFIIFELYMFLRYDYYF